MTQKVLKESVVESFLEAERFAAKSDSFVYMVVPSANGSNLYHVNVLGPGKELGDVDYRVIHEALKVTVGAADLNDFLDHFKPESVLPDRYLEWEYTSRVTQMLLVLRFEAVDFGNNEPPRDFWTIRRTQESKKDVSWYG